MFHLDHFPNQEPDPIKILVDFASAKYNPHYPDANGITILKKNNQTIILLTDGFGSWAYGQESSQWVLDYLTNQWLDQKIFTQHELLDDLNKAPDLIPDQFKDIHTLFSATLIFVENDQAWISFAGKYQVVHLRAGIIINHTTPHLGVDQY